jgi:hypothetical protein
MPNLSSLAELLHRLVNFLPLREENDLKSLHEHVDAALKDAVDPTAPTSEDDAKDGQ